MYLCKCKLLTLFLLSVFCLSVYSLCVCAYTIYMFVSFHLYPKNSNSKKETQIRIFCYVAHAYNRAFISYFFSFFLDEMGQQCDLVSWKNRLEFESLSFTHYLP